MNTLCGHRGTNSSKWYWSWGQMSITWTTRPLTPLINVWIVKIVNFYSSEIMQLLIKLKFSSLMHGWPWPILAILF